MDAGHVVQIAVIGLMLVAVVVKMIAQRRQGARAIVIHGPWELFLLVTFWAWLAMIVVHGLGIAPQLFGRVLWESAVLDTIGMGLVISGTLLALAAFWVMGRSWRIGIDEQAREELVTTGVFAFSRNPIFLFFDWLAIGMACISGTVFFVATAPFILAATHAQIRREERYLRRTFGVEYQQYCRRVRRYFGRRGAAVAGDSSVVP